MSAFDPKRTCPTGLIQISAQLDQVSKFSFRRDAMTIYISRGRFTSDAVKGMVAKPENREEAVSKLCESVGGRLIGWYLTFGHHDWLSIAESPDDKAAASAIRSEERRVGKGCRCRCVSL